MEKNLLMYWSNRERSERRLHDKQGARLIGIKLTRLRQENL